MTHFEKIKEKAEQGDIESQWDIGHRYYYGIGVALDSAEALKWFKKSAEQGHAGAQLGLSHMYNSGDGVKLDFEEAHHWRYKASLPRVLKSK